MPADHPSDSQRESRPFSLQRKRVGQIRFVQADGEFGFIDAEDFRDDVFFHKTVWQSDTGQVPQEHMAVEFEIDDEHRRESEKLRAKVVRPTKRPLPKKLSGRDATFTLVHHHPKARRKRPDWRQ